MENPMVKIKDELFESYVKTYAICRNYEDNYKSELEEKIDPLRDKLKVVRESVVKLKEIKKFTVEQKLEEKNLGLEIVKLDSRINKCEDIKEKYKTAKDNVKEHKYYHKLICTLMENKDFMTNMPIID